MTAAQAVAAVRGVQGGVEVVGSGPYADHIRQLLPQGQALLAHETKPEAIIETTGGLAELAGAMERVDDLGTIVVAGPAPSVACVLDLYGDLHVRGLTLIGVPFEDA